MKKFWALLFISALGFVCGSATSMGGTTLSETPLSLTETRKAIASVIGEARMVSENGRELYSTYYDDKGLRFQDGTKVKSRYFSKITVLGDRRPYDGLVQVIKETKGEEGNFSLDGVDEEKSERLSQKINQALHQGLDNRNVIDDFRAF